MCACCTPCGGTWSTGSGVSAELFLHGGLVVLPLLSIYMLRTTARSQDNDSHIWLPLSAWERRTAFMIVSQCHKMWHTRQLLVSDAWCRDLTFVGTLDGGMHEPNTTSAARVCPLLITVCLGLYHLQFRLSAWLCTVLLNKFCHLVFDLLCS